MNTEIMEKEFLGGRYIVTSSSDVFRVKDGKRKKVNKILTPKGKLVVYLDNGVSSRQYSVGKIVAQCFVENPNHYRYVNYIDGDPTNNVYTNLVWSTKNVPRAIRKTKHDGEKKKLVAFLESTPADEISYNQAETVRRRLNDETYAEISEALHISKQAANKIVLNIIGNDTAAQAKLTLINKQISALSEKIERKERRISALKNCECQATKVLEQMKLELNELYQKRLVLEGNGDHV